MPGVCTCACENLMMAKKPEKLHANMKMACRWVLMILTHIWELTSFKSVLVLVSSMPEELSVSKGLRQRFKVRVRVKRFKGSLFETIYYNAKCEHTA